MELRLEVDENTHERLFTRAEKKGFSNVEAYASFVLEVVMDELEGNEQGAVKERLDDLGYLE